MKALLVTLCGCSQVIEVADKIPFIRRRLETPMAAYFKKIGCEEAIKYRDFYLDHSENLNDTGDILVYKECATE